MTEAIKIRTLKDLFEKVPSEKLGKAMRELTVLMHETHAVNAACAAEGVPPVQFPDEIEWTDDDRGEVTINLSDPAGDIASFTTIVR